MTTKTKAKLPESLRALVNKTTRRKISKEAYQHLSPDWCSARGCSDHGWAADHGLAVEFECVEIPDAKTPSRRDYKFWVSGDAAHVQEVLKAAAVIDKGHEVETAAQDKYKALAEREKEKARATRDAELHKIAQGVVPGAEPWPAPLDYDADKDTATHIAAQFGIMQKGLRPHAVARDAIRLAKLGANARRALEQNQSPDNYVRQAEIIARRYDAEVIDNRELRGWVMALKFPDGAYRSGMHNRLYVS